MEEQRNLILAFVLSIAILLAFQYFYPGPQRKNDEQQAAREAQAPVEAPGVPTPEARDLPAPAGAPAVTDAPESREAVLKKTPRIGVVSPRLYGSISLVGARIDDLTLAGYHETSDRESPEITLLSPPGVVDAYFAEFGWVPGDADVSVPKTDTEWQADGDELRPDAPVTLTWDNGAGLRFVRRIVLDDDYMFTVIRRIENTGTAPVALYPYGLVSRSGTPEPHPFSFYIHEGPVGVLNGTLEEEEYEDVKEEGPFEWTSNGGWIGIKAQYWMVALMPEQEGEIKVRFVHDGRNGGDKYQVDFLGQRITVPARGSVEVTERLFVGAKEVSVLDRYEDELGVVLFHRAIDYTRLFFLTYPLHKILLYLYDILGNYGLSIVVLTVIIKALFFPLANKSYKSMSKMKKLQPKMTELRDRHKDDKQKLQQEMMQLYKDEKVNPAAGCLPMVIQIPVFIGLYIVFLVTIEMRHAPFYGWIVDMSAPDPLGLLTMFGLFDWTPSGFIETLNIGVWPLLMGFTMFLQFRLNPQPPDPNMAKIMMVMPFVFTFILARFPAGLVIYWTWNNMLSIAQQWIINRQAKT